MSAFELLLGATALILGIGTSIAYHRSRDILHPLLFLGPLFFYGAVLDPWLVRQALDRFFRYPQDVNLVLILNLLAVTALVVGALHGLRQSARGRCERQPLSERERVQLRRVAAALAVAAAVAYASGIINTGGFVAAFSQAKGGGRSESGYIGEAMNLGLISAAMAALSQHRRRWTSASLMVLALGLLPNLIQGTFGGRRGPLFLALAAAVLAWTVTRPKQPKVWVLGCALAVLLLSVAFVGSQRRHLYLGSEEAEVKWEQFFDTLRGDNVGGEGNNFIYGAGFVIATNHSGHFTWGRELAVNLLVRPIPRQFWPTKYEDVGATWITSEYPGLGHLSVGDWIDAVGWVPLAGSSGMSISDLFGEFGWGAIVAMYCIGRGFAWLRLRRRTRGGMWDLLYVEALILSIYLATQGFSAFYHRFLILAIPTIVSYKLFMGPRSRSQNVSAGTRGVPVVMSTNGLAR